MHCITRNIDFASKQDLSMLAEFNFGSDAIVGCGGIVPKNAHLPDQPTTA